MFDYVANLTFTMADFFRDVADAFDLFPGYQGLPGGKTFEINGSWQKTLNVPNGCGYSLE